MYELDPSSPGPSSDDRVIRSIAEGTAAETGTEFFRALVKSVADVLGVRGAWISEFTADARRLRTLAFWMGGEWIDGFEFDLAGTPCEEVIHGRRLILVPERVVDLYPEDPYLPLLGGAVAYMGAPLKDTDGRVIGNIAILHDSALQEDSKTLAVFRTFAARAAAELRRLGAEAEVREREEELASLVRSAMDGILSLDPAFRITRANPAAAMAFRAPEGRLLGSDFSRFLTRQSRGRLRRLMGELDERPERDRSLWIAGGLEAVRWDGRRFPAEATLSRFEVQGRAHYTLILRDVDERRRSERQLSELAAEAEYLRAELDALENFGEIIGRSEALRQVMREVRQVAATAATVLILGETGTGKELIARAIHDGSPRREKPLVRVSCAAVPPTLIESEFFGHEKGAFTGATARREGRFALAHGGTMFLDEVGELPLELQGKLLRVLQEGEFEPVGSERTRSVDVRVIAATNRFLEARVRAGDFREDLYYRLNVFPIVLPPLRERGDDVVLLARAFLETYSRRLGRRIAPLDDLDLEWLRSYSWPGNVRELQNVIERGVITARGDRINLPKTGPSVPSAEAHGVERYGAPGAPGVQPGPPVLTARELRELERKNLIRALEATGWRVAGEGGAARLMGVPPTTLASRMRALGIERPARPRLFPPVARSRNELS